MALEDKWDGRDLDRPAKMRDLELVRGEVRTEFSRLRWRIQTHWMIAAYVVVFAVLITLAVIRRR